MCGPILGRRARRDRDHEYYVFFNKDKYQYLDSSLKHAQIHTHTCLMVLYSHVQQSPGSHFAVVILAHECKYNNIACLPAICLKTTQLSPDSAEIPAEQPTEATSTAWCEHKTED